ncbi:MAG: hypothetical protein H6563_01125 [Lewinellaceae bacterium]|nr:hypothetical protein [Lewinellaceae bacterium]
MEFIESYGDRDIRRGYVLVGIAFLILLIAMVYDAIRIGEPYPVIMETKFSGTLERVAQQKSHVYLILDGKSESWEVKDCYNYNYNPSGLMKFLNKGDYLEKHYCSDTLFITRRGEKFHFLIGDSNYNHPGKTEEFKQYWRARREIVTKDNKCQ